MLQFYMQGGKVLGQARVIVRVLSFVYRGGVLHTTRGLPRVKTWAGDGLCLLCSIISNLAHF